MEDYKRKYEDAFKKAKDLHDNHALGMPFIYETCEQIFPELKESEDERIRKDIISLVKETRVSERFYDLNKMLSWLEKQGEHKPTDKVEPKFKVGDWCIDNEDGTIFQIMKVLDNTYRYKTDEGEEYSCTHYSLENDAHLWTIQDAKDGDVLYHKSPLTGIECIVMSRGVNDNECTIDSYFRYNTKYGLDINIPSVLNTISNDITPATKEQRDLLFDKIKESGYEWDAEKKELKKIEQNSSEDNCKISDCDIKVDMDEYNKGFECGKQRVLKYPEDFGLCEKPTWSEEDKRMIDSIIKNLDEGEWLDIYQADWLESFKERMKG